ncbi:MAG: hypothetical protein JWN35_3588 [Frankiales bacterium]|nr:hypothetical protein [Frankiales bacterium]
MTAWSVAYERLTGFTQEATPEVVAPGKADG